MSATGIDYQTFLTFHNAVRANVAPEGLAENLIVPFRSWVGYALSDLQTLIPWYRAFNVQLYAKTDVDEFCSTSYFQGPQGKITQLFAFKPDVDCKRLYYQKKSPAALDCWMERQRCLCPATDPPSDAIYDSPYCNYVIAGETACAEPYLTGEEDDERFKCLDDDDRIFAVSPDYKVHAAPRFPCGYTLLLQWQGINKAWVNADRVPIDNQLQEAVEYYAEHRMFQKEQQGATSDYWNAYSLAIRMLKFRYRDEQDEEMKRDCSGAIERLVSSFQIAYPTPLYT